MEAIRPITLVEVPPFERLVAACMTENELDEFKYFIAVNPRAGARMQGTGGIRKVRWAVGGKGKSGGVRIIYYYHNDEIPLFLLTVYPKSRKQSLTAGEKARLRELARAIVATYRGRRESE